MPRKLLRKRKPITRRRTRKVGFLDRKYSVKDIAVNAWRGMKYIKGLINVEKKFFDVSAYTQVPTSTPSIVNLSNIAEGNDYNQRDGNSILLQSLQWRMNLAANASATRNFLRIIIFRDNDQRGTDPAPGDLLETTAGDSALVSPLLHYVNQRFSILSDKCYTLNLNGDSGFKMIKKYMKFPPGTHIKYQNTTGADASNWEGALYALFVSDQATNGPSIDYFFRLRFTDN